MRDGVRLLVVFALFADFGLVCRTALPFFGKRSAAFHSQVCSVHISESVVRESAFGVGGRVRRRACGSSISRKSSFFPAPASCFPPRVHACMRACSSELRLESLFSFSRCLVVRVLSCAISPDFSGGTETCPPDSWHTSRMPEVHRIVVLRQSDVGSVSVGYASVKTFFSRFRPSLSRFMVCRPNRFDWYRSTCFKPCLHGSFLVMSTHPVPEKYDIHGHVIALRGSVFVPLQHVPHKVGHHVFEGAQPLCPSGLRQIQLSPQPLLPLLLVCRLVELYGPRQQQSQQQPAPAQEQGDVGERVPAPGE